MRKVKYLWFWNSCFDDERKWTIIFSIVIPLVPMGIMSQILRFLTTKKLTLFSNILMIAFISFINEFLIKVPVGIDTLDKSCYIGFYAPSTFIAISFAMFIVSVSRYITKITRNVSQIIVWGALTILTFVARPILYYLTWKMAGISLIPGLVGSLFWIFFVEKAGFDMFLLPLTISLSLRNDINGSAKKEQNLLSQ